MSRGRHNGLSALLRSVAAYGSAVAFIVAMTLRPAGGEVSAGWSSYTVGEFGLASAILNILLFIPLGLVLAGRGVRLIHGLLAAALLSLSIESAQLFIPGRNPLLSDIVLNVAGTGAGVLLWRSLPFLLSPGHTLARRLIAGWAAGLVALPAAVAALSAPALPAGDYFIQWAPDLGGMERFDGRLVSVTDGQRALGPGWLDDPERFRARFRTHGTISAHVRMAAPTRGLSPIVRIVDRAGREVALVGSDREELVFRYRTRAAAARLHRPEIRAKANPVGAEAEVIAVRQAAFHCLGINETLTCGFGVTTGRSWGLLRDSGGVSPRFRRAVDLIWLAAIFLPLGFWSRTGVASVLSIAAALLATALLPAVLHSTVSSPSETVAAACGILAGIGLSRVRAVGSGRASGRTRAGASAVGAAQ